MNIINKYNKKLKLLLNKALNSGLLSWHQRFLRHQRLVLILSIIIGILSAIAAIALKNCFHYANYIIVYSNYSSFTNNYLLLIYPIVGLLLTVLFVKYWIKDDISHGVSKILYAISKRNSKIKPHNSYSSIIASTLTIAFGGSVGAEAPIALTGSSIGSNLGRLFKFDYKTLTLLIGCGSAGAISAIFKAPIAGVIFTLEVLMLDLTMSSIHTFAYIICDSSIADWIFDGAKCFIFFHYKRTICYRKFLLLYNFRIIIRINFFILYKNHFIYRI